MSVCEAVVMCLQLLLCTNVNRDINREAGASCCPAYKQAAHGSAPGWLWATGGGGASCISPPVSAMYAFYANSCNHVGCTHQQQTSCIHQHMMSPLCERYHSRPSINVCVCVCVCVCMCACVCGQTQQSSELPPHPHHTQVVATLLSTLCCAN